MAVRKTVGVYERPQKRGTSARAAALAAAVAIAAVAGVAVVYFF